MADSLPLDQRWSYKEGAPKGDPLMEITVRLHPADFPTEKRVFSGATVSVAYPTVLESRALDRTAVLRHAISTLLDALDGSMTATLET
jgi:hypothetical protein